MLAHSHMLASAASGFRSASHRGLRSTGATPSLAGTCTTHEGHCDPHGLVDPRGQATRGPVSARETDAGAGATGPVPEDELLGLLGPLVDRLLRWSYEGAMRWESIVCEVAAGYGHRVEASFLARWRWSPSASARCHARASRPCRRCTRSRRWRSSSPRSTAAGSRPRQPPSGSPAAGGRRAGAAGAGAGRQPRPGRPSQRAYPRPAHRGRGPLPHPHAWAGTAFEVKTAA